MQALFEKILENKSFLFIAWAIGLLLFAALILFLVRLAFGRRLKTPGGGRTRLPRLGIVDAFDLDRQRQLVIVRRDNVEHLLMIGGPNDLVIESEIIRYDNRDLRAREKEPRESLQAAVQAPSPAAPAWQPQADPAPMRIVANHHQPARKTPVPPLAPALDTDGESQAPGLVAPSPVQADTPAVFQAAITDEPVAQSATPAAPTASIAAPPAPVAPPAPAITAPRTPSFPLPPRRSTQPLGAPQRAPREPLGRPDSRIEPGAFPRAPLTTPFLRTPPRQLADSLLKGPMAPAQSASPTAATVAAPEAARNTEAAPASSPAATTAPEAATPPSESIGAQSPPPAIEDGPEPPSRPVADAADRPADETAKAPDAQEPSVKEPAAKEQAFEEASILAPDSLDHLLEEEMARLLGRGS